VEAVLSETRNAAQHQLIGGATGSWEVVIGMEVHAQVTSKSKLFSSASAEFGGNPNSHVSLVDAAMPGMLPVINRYCVEQAIRTGLGLKAQINKRSVFDRKNYFYPDLPQGYQISQYKQPIVGEGSVVIDMPDGPVAIGIERLHLEQDAGKSLHDQHPTQSYVDLNRSGVALMEIVSRPDMRSSEEAKAYVSKLRTILRYLGTCDGNMEQGSLRADINVSVRQPGDKLGTRCEIKNVNSIRFMGQAIEYKPAARSVSSRRVERSTRRPACSMRGRATPARCAPRRRPTTIVIFPILTCCRLNSATNGLTASPYRFPNFPTRRRRGSSPPMPFRPMTRACWSPSARPPIFSKPSHAAATVRLPQTG
jgi:hypothetical protein